MMPFTRARDTFTVWMEETLIDPATGLLLHRPADKVIGVVTFETPQQLVTMNALNIKYLADRTSIENSVWETMVSLDIYIGDNKSSVSGEVFKPQRIAVERWQEAVFASLRSGTTIEKGAFVRTVGLTTRGAWDKGAGHLVWQNLEGLSFKDIPSETYIHKNLTLQIQLL